MEQTTTSSTSAEAGKRPTFLTVLCILSFVFSGFAIIGLVILLLGMGAVTAAANAAQNMAADAGISTANVTYTGPSIGMTWAYLIVGFLGTLIGLFGVIQMWKLKKIGFFIYTIATVASVVMGIVYSGFGFMSVMPFLFVVLYGLNLKHLK